MTNQILQVSSLTSAESEIILKIFPAIIGAFIGAFLTKLLNRNRERVSLTFEMHRELNNFEMSQHRRKADNLIKLFPNTSYEDIASINDNESISAFVLMRFFQRLSQSIKYNQIKLSLAPELFADVFYFWYYISYEKNLIHLDWEAGKQIRYLANWFENKLSHETHSKLKKELTAKLARRIESLTPKK